MADLSADADIISVSVLEKIRTDVPIISSKRLSLSQMYRNITGELSITCNQPVKQDVSIQITHSTSLILRNVIWKVTKEKLQTPIIDLGF